MQDKRQLTEAYLALLDQLRHLFARENLTNNNYLFKHMKPTLTLPLFLIAEERKIAALTTNQQDLIAAITQTGMAKVVNGRQVTIIEWPTIKIHLRHQDLFSQIEAILKQANKKYAFSERVQRQLMNLTLFEHEDTFLLQLVASLSKEIQFEKANLYEDIRRGTANINKLKQQHRSHTNTQPQKGKFSFDKPPQIFIRRAVDSSDDEAESKPKVKKTSKKYKQAVKEEQPKPKFNSEDFPSLS